MKAKELGIRAMSKLLLDTLGKPDHSRENSSSFL